MSTFERFKLNPAYRYHFIGIGGIGMSALAIFLHEMGYVISGSDSSNSDMLLKLERMGIDISRVHHTGNAEGAQVVIYSSAVKEDNIELITARRFADYVLHRADLLAAIASDYPQTIAITGTHGKTTVSAMVAHMLTALGFNPAYIVGGIVHSLKSHASYSDSQWLVVEADESDASLIKLSPRHIIVTNIDSDHMATYDYSDRKLIDTYLAFINKPSVSGQILIGVDMAFGNECINKVLKSCQSYGFSEKADLQARQYRFENGITTFTLEEKMYKLDLPGRHNVNNALAAIGFCLGLGVAEANIQQVLSTFKGVKRRFDCRDIIYNGSHITVIDDYGHHPAEVLATVSAARERFIGRRLVHIYQPHRYTRNRDYFVDWIAALKQADVLILCDVYSAGEEKITGAEAKDLLIAIATEKQNCHGALNLEMAQSILDNIVVEGDVVLIQGAGDITRLTGKLIDAAR
ncbi:MAG: UDP-N-acetylmuramate--L-alanine ligase [Francisellaceae bacterium]